MNGTIIATINEINSKFDKIIGLKFSIDIILPTKRLDWKFWLGKNNKPELKPRIIDTKDNLVLIFFLKRELIHSLWDKIIEELNTLLELNIYCL